MAVEPYSIFFTWARRYKCRKSKQARLPLPSSAQLSSIDWQSPRSTSPCERKDLLGGKTVGLSELLLLETGGKSGLRAFELLSALSGWKKNG
jgi:hypothetical protein